MSLSSQTRKILARPAQIAPSLTVGKALRGGLFALILAFLLYRLTHIGWGEIARALPTSPLFYLLSIGFVLAPVVAESLSFQTITGRRARPLFRLFLRKHVVNKAVMNYAGDAWFVQQLATRAEPGQPALGLKRAAIVMKDMTLVRAFVANGWILLLILGALALGKGGILQKMVAVSPALAVAVGILALGVCGGAVLLFRRLTRLSWGVAGRVASLYFARTLFITAILVAQWSLAMPGTPLATWFAFLLVFSITKKSPVGGELVFAALVVTLPGLGGDSAAAAAMLIALAAVAQALYFVGFLATAEVKPQTKSKPVLRGLPA